VGLCGGAGAALIDEAVMAAFRAAPRAAGHRRSPGPRGMLPLLADRAPTARRDG